jgi:NTE family protein
MAETGTVAGETVLNIALQGGGAHGAYSWGVLDCLLMDGRFRFEGVSGTSAGAMNAVVLADGLMKGGWQGARRALAEFWLAVAESVPLDLSTQLPGGDAPTLLPGTKLMMNWAQYLSPYQLNPLNFNPLRDILLQRVDFAGLRSHSPLHLFLAATQVRTGKLRLFREHELTADMVLASACLPVLHHAIEIDGEAYWDGGYTANPAIFPLFYDCAGRDILLVLLAPPSYGETPRSVEEIRARTLEFAFNTSVLREMLLFANVGRFTAGRPANDDGFERKMQETRFHLLEATDLLHQFGHETRLAADWPFLVQLHDLGQAAATSWLAGPGRQVGVRTSFDLQARFGL